MVCFAVYFATLARFKTDYYEKDQEIERMTGLTAVFFFCLQLVAVLVTYILFTRIASKKHHFEYKAHERRLRLQFGGVVVYIMINITSNFVGVLNTTETNDNVLHFFGYLLSQLSAITVIILSHKVEDCFHCFNCIQHVPYSSL
jgi:hypothetical protein